MGRGSVILLATALVIVGLIGAGTALLVDAAAAERPGSGVVIAADTDAGTLLLEGIEAGVERVHVISVEPTAAIRDHRGRELGFESVQVGDIIEYASAWFAGIEIAFDLRVTRMSGVADAAASGR